MNQTLMVPSPATALPFTPAAARIAMVSAGWHAELLAHARHRFRATLREWGVPDSGFLEHEVPGAFEIPLAAQRLCAVYVSLTTLDPQLARILEPRAAAPHRRLQTIKALTQAGIRVGVSVSPAPLKAWASTMPRIVPLLVPIAFSAPN